MAVSPKQFREYIMSQVVLSIIVYPKSGRKWNMVVDINTIIIIIGLVAFADLVICFYIFFRKHIEW